MAIDELLFEYPWLSLLAVIPFVGLAALIKVGIVLATGREEPPDVDTPG